jgi:sporulation protein YlmC with PRC-barrel domain
MKTVTAAAIAVLLSTSAFAQSPTPSPSRPAGNSGEFPATTGVTQAPGSSSAQANHFQTNQGQDQWLVGNLWHKNVYNSSGQSIGDLNDIVLDKDGKIAALVVGVGGFLGLGEKNVAVDWDQVKQHGSIAPDRIVLGFSEQDLRNAPAFKRSGSESSR